MELQLWDAFRETLPPAEHMDEIRGKNKALRHPGTCSWVFEDEAYLRWENETNTTLFCVGPPGVGKSVLATAVIDELKKSESLVLFLFCENDTQQMDYLTGSLIRQLLAQVDSEKDLGLLDNVGRNIGQTVLRTLLCHRSTSRNPGRASVSLVFDGLDRIDLEVSRSLLAFFSSLRDEIDIKIFATSTFPASLTAGEESVTTLPMLASNADLTEYITYHVTPPGSLSRPEHTKFYDDIVEATEGIFHVASRIVEILSPMRTKFEFQQFLRHWTQEYRHLDHVFNDLIKPRTKRLQSGLAPNVINWLTFSHRTLTTLELRHALVADISEYLRAPPELDEITLALHGIVMIENEPGWQSIRFFHSALHAYFRHKRDNEAFKIQDKIVSYCLRQLSRVSSSDGFCESDEDFEERLRHNPFFLYAACHWGYHTQACSEPVPAALRFLDNHASVEMSSQAIFIEKASSDAAGYTRRVPRHVTGLHLAAYFGMHGAAEELLNEGASLSSVDTQGQTPLWWAARFGQDKIVRLFCRSDTTTLSLLMMAKETNLIRILLRAKYKVNTPDASHDTPLHHAVRRGLVETVGDLLSAAANTNMQNMGGETPLGIALNNSNQEIIHLLIGKGAYTDFVNTAKFRKAFHWQDDQTLEIFRDDRTTVLRLKPSERRHFDEWGQSERFSLQQKVLRDIPFPPQLRESIDNLQIEELNLEIIESRDNDSHINYYVEAFMWNSPSNDEPLPCEQLVLCWDVYQEKQTQQWYTKAHFTTMPHIWLPDNGAVFLRHFLVHVKHTWLAYCEANLVDLHLRKRIIGSKGADPELLDHLLENGQKWLSHRHKLSKVALKIRNFAKAYCLKHNETGDLEELIEAIDELSAAVGKKLGELDENSRDLIQLECNLVSIKEARESVNSSTSMKRLSWITFIFLPLTFIGTLFGMNIDILDETKPAWWTYIPFAAVTSLMTSVVWLLFQFTEVGSLTISLSVYTVRADHKR
ncbi:hypothetical protein CORC01_06687 [Colletotrichum orchidophilum]|uniref:AAA+ ATPase domain-containing protein n=1 Tax=Colletotrichum orchidophilum TaxID=1209926 RepID=A0A1G4B9E5_9PEZI|nr:uncharacterized protein CORC01_06687 [Colletotrichum orchidophilum]OHE98018.1 hypothetical protein CORC01_06687 [Colletotrichum orchidophilum]